MEKTIQQRIFEPFFTTKEVGKGTGLGLSIIYGILKQHNGYINCYSEPSVGTTFKIYLPLLDAGTGTPDFPTIMAEAACGTETILLAEDDEQLRILTKNLLEGHGYTVITALDGDDALAKFAQSMNIIDLTILDVIMPKKNGKEVYEGILKISPQCRVLFTSGYPEEVFNMDEIVAKGLDFIAKPFIPSVMMHKVKQLLERESA
jgi:two-component system cell cycle sensor histidine kinase/response regulator CckA